MIGGDTAIEVITGQATCHIACHIGRLAHDSIAEPQEGNILTRAFSSKRTKIE